MDCLGTPNRFASLSSKSIIHKGKSTFTLFCSCSGLLAFDILRYSEMSLIFFLTVFSLGMASGYIIYKTKSIWGAVIFHMGYDLFYALAFGFASVK